MVHDELPQADSVTWCRVHRGNQVSHQLYVTRVLLCGFLLHLAELLSEFGISDRRSLLSSSVLFTWHNYTAFIWMSFVCDAIE